MYFTHGYLMVLALPQWRTNQLFSTMPLPGITTCKIYDLFPFLDNFKEDLDRVKRFSVLHNNRYFFTSAFSFQNPVAGATCSHYLHRHISGNFRFCFCLVSLSSYMWPQLGLELWNIPSPDVLQTTTGCIVRGSGDITKNERLWASA